MFCVSELDHDTSLTVPHFIHHALVTWAMKLAIDSLMFICNLALSFLGQDYVPSYTFSCCDQKCCVSILDRWLRLSLSLRSVVSDLSHAMDCSPPVSSVHGDFSDKNTGTGCHASPGESSQPRDQTHVSCVSCLSVQFSRSVVSDSLRLHESQHARPPCSSPSPGVHSDSCPSSP